MMRAYARQGTSISARDGLILDHMEMARRIACRLARRLPPSITLEEVVAAAVLGLAEAASRFDGNRGEPFEAFAAPRIRGAVLDELRRGDPLPRRRRSMARKIGETIRRIEGQKGRAAEEEEVAEELGVSLEQYHGELEGLTHMALVELDDRTVSVDPHEEEGRAHLLSPLSLVERADLREAVVEMLKSLPEKQAMVMSLYYDQELTFAEIAQVIGVTESRVCQIHTKVVCRLRAMLEGDEDKE